ncbi:unnamed protein product [Caenorhabditis auriculariae]|uniref:BZIP domain-containing protein n=1 Tax=Caenorhabditis auriculariae TaxID=2777116 RepID=A0A8S1H3N5_9PELO|nr:unnamed protein product [Caenorhabditis auriculariae]
MTTAIASDCEDRRTRRGSRRVSKCSRRPNLAENFIETFSKRNEKITKMCAYYAEADFSPFAFSEPAPPLPYLSPFLEESGFESPLPAGQWGVWPDHSTETAAFETDGMSRVRCGTGCVNRNCCAGPKPPPPPLLLPEALFSPPPRRLLKCNIVLCDLIAPLDSFAEMTAESAAVVAEESLAPPPPVDRLFTSLADSALSSEQHQHVSSSSPSPSQTYHSLNSHHISSPPSCSELKPQQNSPDSSIVDVDRFLDHANFDEFGADVYTDYTYDADFTYIDGIIEQVRQEIHSEKTNPSKYPSGKVRMSPPPTLLKQGDSRKSSAASSDVFFIQGSTSPQPVFVEPGKPVTLIGEDGKEYKLVVQPVQPDAPSTSSASSPTSSTSSPPPSAGRKSSKRRPSSDNAEPVRKRAPGVSLAQMTDEEIAERKKEQNRVAAQRYRQKIKECKASESEEGTRLMKRNDFLRNETIRLEKEISDLRSVIFSRVDQR